MENKFNIIKLPIITKFDTEQFAKDICNVQPMTGECAQIFSLKARYAPKWYNFIRLLCRWLLRDKFGDMLHSFFEGWKVFDGKVWIPRQEFIEKYGVDKINRWPKPPTTIYEKIRYKIHQTIVRLS